MMDYYVNYRAAKQEGELPKTNRRHVAEYLSDFPGALQKLWETGVYEDDYLIYYYVTEAVDKRRDEPTN